MITLSYNYLFYFSCYTYVVGTVIPILGTKKSMWREDKQLDHVDTASKQLPYLANMGLDTGLRCRRIDIYNYTCCIGSCLHFSFLI